MGNGSHPTLHTCSTTGPRFRSANCSCAFSSSDSQQMRERRTMRVVMQNSRDRHDKGCSLANLALNDDATVMGFRGTNRSWLKPASCYRFYSPTTPLLYFCAA